jgi:Holliday junction DNA helicase RuvB
MMRTPRGRVATNAAYIHFGLDPRDDPAAPGESAALF